MTASPLPADLPAVLRDPPWVPARKRKKLVLPVLPPREERIAERSDLARPGWLDASLEVAPDRDKYASMSQEERDRDILTIIASAGILPIYAARYLSEAAMLVALEKAPQRFIEHYRLAHVALGRFGLRMLEPLLGLFERAPSVVFDCFRYVDSPRIATLLADKHADIATEWFLLYPGTTAAMLVPVALTGSAKESGRALKTLARLIAARHEQAVLGAARALGEDALAELELLLAPPPLPAKPPVLPSFYDPSALPAPKLRASGVSLSAEQVERLGQLLALLPLGAARTAVASVREACDETSLGDFSRMLVDRWVEGGAPTKEKWVLLAAAVLGDDLVAHRLADEVATWAADGHHSRAAAGAEALRELGSDVALAHLLRFAEKSKAKGLKKRARAELDAYREETGLDEDALADRLVPALGFDARGELTLSYGPRAFRVVFDETLKASLMDGERAIRSLPKTATTDDPALAERAQATWQALKVEAKTLVETQVRRLERAMCARRRWTHEAFEKYLRRHPLMQHVARRVVWGAFDSVGALTTTFRIAEDGTLASVDDEVVDEASIGASSGRVFGIAHPIALGASLAARWGNVFGDYQIVQPFPQLAREVCTLTEAELAATKLTRFIGMRAEGSRFFGLRHRGWDFTDYNLGKRLSGAHFATLETTPGLEFLAAKPADQTLGELTLRTTGEVAPTFRELDPLLVSELVRDVEMLTR